MTPEQVGKAFDFLSNRIDRADLKRAGVDPPGTPDFFERELAAAKAARSGEALDATLSLARHFGLVGAEQMPRIAALLLEPWHYEHENLAMWLQHQREPATADVLAQAATMKHDILVEQGREGPFARKCTWALADIGTPAARAHLERLAKHADEEIAGYAQRRLDMWDIELPRKGKKPK